MPISESDHRRGKFGSRKGRIRVASLLGGRIARGDYVRLTTSRGLNSGGWAARPVQGGGQRAGRMQFRLRARGEGELYSCKAARQRNARSGELNQKRQRTAT